MYKCLRDKFSLLFIDGVIIEHLFLYIKLLTILSECLNVLLEKIDLSDTVGNATQISLERLTLYHFENTLIPLA